jgi:hypothetical protein
MLLFALVLGLSALAASVSPAPDQNAAPRSQSPGGPVEPPRTIAFAVREGLKPQTRTVRTGERLTVVVTAEGGGVVSIPELGRTASASATAPARFNLLASAEGSYAVLVEPPTGEEQRAGTLVVKRGPL